MALAALLSGCSFFDNLAESLTVVNEIEMPEKPVAYEMPDVECIADELRSSQWFDYWCSEVLDGNNSVTVAEGLDTEQVKKAIILMRSDYPQIFWQGELFSVTSNSFETTIEVPTISGIELAEIPQLSFQDGKLTLVGGGLDSLVTEEGLEMTYADGAYGFAIEFGELSIKFSLNLLQDGLLGFHVFFRDDGDAGGHFGSGSFDLIGRNDDIVHAHVGGMGRRAGAKAAQSGGTEKLLHQNSPLMN